MEKNSQTRLQTTTIPVDDLVDDVKRGRIRIPSFQRGLKWTRRDVIRLFESIVNGYPIGNLLLWERKAEAASDIRIGALRVSSEAQERALFVVDGQQRLTSLANALNTAGLSDARFALSYDVMKYEFVPYTENQPSQIPLPTIFNLSELLKWFSQNPELTATPGLIERVNAVAKSIREFRVPVYVVEQGDANILRDIFDRMNNYGKQLTRAEVFSALHETETGEKGQNSTTGFADIAEAVQAATGFGVLDEDTVFLTFLARRGSDVSRDIRKEFAGPTGQATPSEFPHETASEAHDRTTLALINAVTFLQDEVGIPHLALLPYRFLIAVVTRFFSHFPEPSAASRRNLRRWCWRAVVRGPEYFKGSSTGATRTLSSRVRPGDEIASVANLIDAVSGPNVTVPQLNQFKTHYSATRLLLAALWSLEPARLNYTDGSRYTVADLQNALAESSTARDQSPMIFRRADISKEQKGLAANRVFLADPAETIPDNILEVLVPIVRLAHGGDIAARTTLASHAIDDAAADLLTQGSYAAFLDYRQVKLTQLLADFLNSRAEWKFEDTPPLSSFDFDNDDDDDEDEDDL